MKNTITKLKLLLTRETVKLLSSTEVARVAGGAGNAKTKTKVVPLEKTGC